ncbi:MAG: NAD(P)H-hydrate dehydratase [Bacteroidales bacterium]
MKFFPTQKNRELDRYTIEHEPIASIDLMERAAVALFDAFSKRFRTEQPVFVFAGSGNNGGDALALARLLLQSGYRVHVWLVSGGNQLSTDCKINRQRLLSVFPDSLLDKFSEEDIPHGAVVVDGLFGSGLSRPLSGEVAEVVHFINDLSNFVVAIDIPSGLNGEENDFQKQISIVKADMTLSLQFPKLAFLLPENELYVGEWEVLNIGIHPEAIANTASDFHYLEQIDVAPLIKLRSRFGHKGSYGHALVVAGSLGMAGAAILSSKAALKSGAGLVTLHSAAINNQIVQISLPEVISQPDKSADWISKIEHSDQYDAIAIGPGIGAHPETELALENLFLETKKAMVIDADALNIIAGRPVLLLKIPKKSILTPHPKEFDRLFGTHSTHYKRIETARTEAMKLGAVIVLKGAYTVIALPNGELWFNSTGNPGMATGGSGDVLTGMLVGLLAQGYSPESAAKIGVFLHGRAADLALSVESVESLIAGNIIDWIGRAFKSVLKR